jgi:hypothetical protein
MASLGFYDHIDPGQGGAAQVIPEYNWYQIPVLPILFPCKQCSEVFVTYDEWFSHRFHFHPIQRPMLVWGRNELTAPRFDVTTKIKAGQIRSVNCSTCTVNGAPIPLDALETVLGSKENGFYAVRLFSDEGKVETKYEVSVEIPSEDHIRQVEIDFGKLAATGSLNIHSINAFIQSTAKAVSAKRYIDGLANYLFGILGKDQHGETGLTQEEGFSKLNEAHQTLRLVEQPLARVVCAIIEFQLNAFSNTSGLQSVPRLQHAIAWYLKSTRGVIALPENGHISDDSAAARVPLDSSTDELLTWISSSKSVLIGRLKHIEKRSKQPDWLPGDRVKALVLASAIHKAVGDKKSATQMARNFRHDPVFRTLAEHLIDTSEDSK